MFTFYFRRDSEESLPPPVPKRPDDGKYNRDRTLDNYLDFGQIN